MRLGSKTYHPDGGRYSNMSTDTEDRPPESRVGGLKPSQRVVLDWLVTAFLVLAGFALLAVGYVSFDSVDPEWFTDLVEEGTVRSDVFTEQEVIDVMTEVLYWGGIGVAILGVLLVVVGLGYMVMRRRDHRRARERGVVSSTIIADGIVGAVVTVVTSFIPFSALIGGGVAGYLYGGDRLSGAKAGALSGILLALPTVLILGFLTLGFASAGLSWLTFVLVFALIFSTAFLVGLSAIGGYLGVLVAERSA